MRIKQTGIGGAMHTVYISDFGADIAPACFAICQKRLKGLGSSVDALREKINVPARFGANGPAASGTTELSTEEMAGLIRSGGLSASSRTVSAFGICHTFRQAGARKVFIAQIEWSNGGLHYVVVPGLSRAGQVIALDPHYGGQLCQLCPKYAVRDTEHARTGRFTGQVIEVTV